MSSESDESSSSSDMEMNNGSDTKEAIDIAVSHIVRDVLSEGICLLGIWLFCFALKCMTLLDSVNKTTDLPCFL